MDNTSKCSQLEGAIAEYALGERAQLPEEGRVQVEQHLADCPACRSALEEFKAIGSAFPRLDDIEVPQEVMERAHNRITSTIQQKEREHRTAVEKRDKTIWFWRISAAAVAASVILVAMGLILSQERGRHEAISQPDSQCLTQTDPAPSQRHEPVIPTLEDRFAKVEEPAEALSLLKAEFAAAKAKPKGADFERILALAQKLMDKWGGSKEALDGRLLLSRCQSEVGAREEAKRTFLAYADEMGERDKEKALESGASDTDAADRTRNATATAIRRESDRCFRQKGYLESLVYADVLLSRYPGTRYAHDAMYRVGRYYHAIGQPNEALSALRELLDSNPGVRLRRLALKRMSHIAFNRGSKEQALDILKEAETRLGDDRHFLAYATMQRGMLLHARGDAYQAAALQEFQAVLSRYPESRYAAGARKMMALVRDDVMDSVFQP